MPFCLNTLNCAGDRIVRHSSCDLALGKLALGAEAVELLDPMVKAVVLSDALAVEAMEGRTSREDAVESSRELRRSRMYIRCEVVSNDRKLLDSTCLPALNRCPRPNNDKSERQSLRIIRCSPISGAELVFFRLVLSMPT